MKNKASCYLLKCPRSRLVLLLGKFSCLKSWIELQIRESFFSHSTRALAFVFIEKNRNNFKRKDFVFFPIKNKKLHSFSCFPREEKHFSSLLFSGKERRKTYSFLVFPKREFSSSETFLLREREKNFFFK